MFYWRVFKRIFFSLFACIVATKFVWSFGLKQGLIYIVLLWSFYVICMPTPSKLVGLGNLTNNVFGIDVKNQARIAFFLVVFISNFLAVKFFPLIYKTHLTAFIYQMIALPGLRWIVILMSFLSLIFNVFFKEKYKTLQTIFSTAGIAFMLYFVYGDVILIFQASLC